MDEYVVYSEITALFCFIGKIGIRSCRWFLLCIGSGRSVRKNVNITYEKNNYEYKFISLTICS